MGKGEFLTNQQVQDRIRAELPTKHEAQLPTPTVSQAAQTIIAGTNADFEKTFGRPAPDLHAQEKPSPYKNPPPFGTRKNIIELHTNENNEDEERLANELQSRLDQANFETLTIEKPKPTPPPLPQKALTAEEEREAQRIHEDNMDRAYGAQASRNGPM